MSVSRFLITGGSQGIGAAVVELARAAGHQVVFTGRNQQLIDAIANKTGAHGLRADVSNADDNTRTVDSCAELLGGVDVLVNNAAYAYRGEIGALDVSKMKEMFDTNVFGLVDLTNKVVPQMKARTQGDIVNLASTSGMKGAATATAYAGSKWALRGISQCWQAWTLPLLTSKTVSRSAKTGSATASTGRLISISPSDIGTAAEWESSASSSSRTEGSITRRFDGLISI
jgi:3-oxoacyl-[acyl-carrier protein] reductase